MRILIAVCAMALAGGCAQNHKIELFRRSDGARVTCGRDVVVPLMVLGEALAKPGGRRASDDLERETRACVEDFQRAGYERVGGPGATVTLAPVLTKIRDPIPAQPVAAPARAPAIDAQFLDALGSQLPAGDLRRALLDACRARWTAEGKLDAPKAFACFRGATEVRPE